MNQLTELIKQYEKETGYRAMNWEGGFSIQFIEKLASRPTCGEEQRLFLDEVEANWYYDEENDFIADTDQGKESNIFADEMESVDLRKVIRGE
jgi:hypothetical protein